MNEEEIQKSLVDLESYRVQLEGLGRQDELLRASLEEHMRARETMMNYKGGKEKEILVPIGANSFLFAKIVDPSKAIVGIGTNLTVEEPIDRAIEKLDKRIGMIEDADRKIMERITGINEKATVLSQQVQRGYEELKKKGQM
jgi:prefoldin alpha subunit